MLKIYTFIFGFALCLGCMFISANEFKKNYGWVNYGDEVVDSIAVNGAAKLDKTTVKKELIVNGSLNANSAFIGMLKVNGKATLSRCKINKKSSVVGFLTATSSQFSEELSLTSEKVVFDSCMLSSIYVHKIPGYPGKQIVELKGRTMVHGSITFEGGKGEVRLDPSSSISGEVVGGKILK